ncbi:hypothetical protein [Brevundimonas sp. TWP2-3-2]|uniref:hypothetical protein n=1 Tax=unclassified Brevundimonas TaxID=2622653 RepID=UPI003CF997A7
MKGGLPGPVRTSKGCGFDIALPSKHGRSMDDKMAKSLQGEPTKTCFFITPIGETGTQERQRADWAFHYVIKPAAEASNLRADRADLMIGSSMIGTNIFRALSEADVCVADMTGLNPNVLYEMGVRHSLRKPIIHIAQLDTKLPFDTAPHLTHFYDLSDYSSMNDLCLKISSEIEHVIEDGYEVSNPFTQALGTIQINKSGDPKDQLVSQLLERVELLEHQNSQNIRISSPVSKERDARDLMENFINNRASTKAYNEKTFKECLDLLSQDFRMIDRIRDAINHSSRPNRATLLEIADAYIPF